MLKELFKDTQGIGLDITTDLPLAKSKGDFLDTKNRETPNLRRHSSHSLQSDPLVRVCASPPGHDEQTNHPRLPRHSVCETWNRHGHGLRPRGSLFTSAFSTLSCEKPGNGPQALHGFLPLPD
jgi:hypothetical protein